MFLLRTTAKFDKQVKKLPNEIRKVLPEKLKILSDNPNHPSLRTKKNYSASSQAKEKILESRVNDKYRMLWKYDGKRVILLLVIGNHKVVE